MAKRWYVVQVKTKHESIALSNLANQNFNAYCPMLRERKMTRGKLDWIILPMFAGYMFVEFDLDKDRWRSIGGTRGVMRVLTATEDKATALPKGFVEQLMASHDDEGFLPTRKAEKAVLEFTVGQAVEVKEGVFAGYTGTCQRIKKDTISVLLSLLNHKTVIEFPKILALPVITDREVR